jgi:FlaA1/EpsC-like NDP-sugar epimerase
VGWWLGILIIVLGRKLLQNGLRSERLKGERSRSGLVIGSSEYASMITSRIKDQPNLGMKIVGRISAHKATSSHTQDTWLRTISQAVAEGDIKYLIIEDSPEADADM